MTGADDSIESSTAWTDNEWRSLLLAIKDKRCTPFLGAGACVPPLRLGGDIAQDWADRYHYPFSDCRNLVRVAQFVSVLHLPETPKYEIKAELLARAERRPDFDDPNQLHRVMADLALPIYLTTNYDDFLRQAFEHCERPRHVRRETCRWYTVRQRISEGVPALVATPEDPVIFHLHGTLDEIDSMVLTEDDYLDFLIYTSEVAGIIPARIEQAFVNSSLLFLGYSLEDLSFKVLFRKLAAFWQRNTSPQHIAVQLQPRGNESPETLRQQQRYLEQQFHNRRVKIYWGDCARFAAELRRRWEAFSGAC